MSSSRLGNMQSSGLGKVMISISKREMIFPRFSANRQSWQNNSSKFAMPLRKMFEFREGRPTSVTKLKEIASEYTRIAKKGVHFIDWIGPPLLDNFYMFVVSDSGLSFYKLEYTPNQAKAWKKEFLKWIEPK